MKHSAANSAISAKSGARRSRLAPMSSTASSSTSFSLKIRIALSGSPTYFGSRKRRVLTRPPSFKSRHGMTRRSISEFQEALEQCHAEAVALLGMELHAEEVGSLGRAA